MTQPSIRRIIAHADLLRAVDRLLEQADDLRSKRDEIGRLFAAESHPARASRKAEVRN
jgi:hypothetical protein